MKGRTIGRGASSDCVCIGCGCTHYDPCEEGCGWSIQSGNQGVCTSCSNPAIIHRFNAGNRALTGKAKARVAEREQMLGRRR